MFLWPLWNGGKFSCFLCFSCENELISVEFLHNSCEGMGKSCAIFLLFIQVVNDFVYNSLDDCTACWNFVEIVCLSFAFKLSWPRMLLNFFSLP